MPLQFLASQFVRRFVVESHLLTVVISAAVSAAAMYDLRIDDVSFLTLTPSTLRAMQAFGEDTLAVSPPAEPRASSSPTQIHVHAAAGSDAALRSRVRATSAYTRPTEPTVWDPFATAIASPLTPVTMGGDWTPHWQPGGRRRSRVCAVVPASTSVDPMLPAATGRIAGSFNGRNCSDRQHVRVVVPAGDLLADITRATIDHRGGSILSNFTAAGTGSVGVSPTFLLNVMGGLISMLLNDDD